jgi:hypothetical protein
VQLGLGFVSPRVHMGMVRSIVGGPLIDDAYLIQELLRLPGTRPCLTEKGRCSAAPQFAGSEAVSANVDRSLPLARPDVRRR